MTDNHKSDAVPNGSKQSAPALSLLSLFLTVLGDVCFLTFWICLGTGSSLEKLILTGAGSTLTVVGGILAGIVLWRQWEPNGKVWAALSLGFAILSSLIATYMLLNLR